MCKITGHCHLSEIRGKGLVVLCIYTFEPNKNIATIITKDFLLVEKQTRVDTHAQCCRGGLILEIKCPSTCKKNQKREVGILS